MYPAYGHTSSFPLQKEYGELAQECMQAPRNMLDAAEQSLRTQNLEDETNVKQLGDAELEELIGAAKVSSFTNPEGELIRLRGTYASLRKEDAADGNEKLIRKINGLAALVELRSRKQAGAKFLEVRLLEQLPMQGTCCRS